MNRNIRCYTRRELIELLRKKEIAEKDVLLQAALQIEADAEIIQDLRVQIMGMKAKANMANARAHLLKMQLDDWKEAHCAHDV